MIACYCFMRGSDNQISCKYGMTWHSNSGGNRAPKRKISVTPGHAGIMEKLNREIEGQERAKALMELAEFAKEMLVIPNTLLELCIQSLPVWKIMSV